MSIGIIINIKVMSEERKKYNEEMGKELKEAREDAGFSQQELADAIGITRQSLSESEKGRRELKVYDMVILEKIFKPRLDI